MALVYLILLLVVSLCICETSAEGTILVNPKSRLVPIGVEVTFKCKIQNGANSHWNINDRAVIYSNTIMTMQAKGWFINNLTVDNTDTLSLRVNATADKNNTQIYCSSYDSHSELAMLIIITENPLSQNPSIENQNATSILLQWSPPYLWPAQAIEYYNISICGARNREFHRVNASFSDPVVSFLKTTDQNSEDTQTCAELTFGITAVGYDRDLPLFSVIGGYIPSSSARRDSTLMVNLTVLFRVDRSPLLWVMITFPQTICSYEHINYSIVIEGDNRTTQYNHGPYDHLGSTAISHTITSGLERDREYTLVAVANTRTGDIMSARYHFNTSLQPMDKMSPATLQPCTASLNHTNFMVPVTDSVVPPFSSGSLKEFLYEILLFAFVGLSGFLLMVLMCICCCAVRQVRKKRIRNSANRVCNAMTNNPIYDGPVYDSIHPQFDTLRNTKTVTPPLDLSLPLSFATNHEQQTDLDSRDSSPTSDRYVKQQTTHSTSHQFQDLGISSTSSNLCTFTTAMSAPSPVVAASNPCNVDVAMSESSHLARERDEELEEQHMLQLSFDLDLHEDQGFPAHKPAEIEDMFSQKFDEILELCSSASASLTPLESTGDDEKYTIMSPVRPLTEGSLNLRGGDGESSRLRQLHQNRGDTVKFEE